MSARTPEEIIKGIEQDFLHMPYNKYVWMRLEFALICNDELEALILRIVEYSIEGQRLAWVGKAMDLASQGKPIPPEPQWWCSFSYRQFMSYLYGVVKNEKTIIKKLTSLINKKFLLRREDPEKPYNAPQYTINKEVVQDRLNGLPKKLPTLKEVVEYHSQHNQPVPPDGTPNNEENDPYQLVVPPVPASGGDPYQLVVPPVPASGGDPYQLVVPNKNNKNITKPKEVEEENAHVSDDNAPTPSLSESNSPSSLQETPIEESTPAPSDEQSSKQESSVSHSQSAPNTTQDSARQAPSEQPTLIARPAKPEMPSKSMRWGPEKIVQITEAFIGKYYDELVRPDEIKAAQKLIKRGAIEETYVEAYCKRNDTWWRETKGQLNVSHMAARTPRGQMRFIELIGEMGGKPTATKEIKQVTNTASAMAEAQARDERNKANIEKMRQRKAAQEAKRQGA